MIKGSKTVRDMSVSGLGALASPLANFIAIPIVARLYGPEAYGVWAILLSIAVIAGTISTLRYELAIVIADNEKEAGQVTVLSFVSVILISAIVAIVIVPLCSLFNFATDNILLWLVPVIVLFSGLKLVFDAVTTRAGLFVLRSSSLVALAVGTGGAQILLHYLGRGGAFGLLLGSVVGFVLSVTILVFGNLFFNKNFNTNLTFENLQDVARKHNRFPRFSVPYTLTGNLRREGTKLIMGVFGSPALVGAFALSQRVTNFPALAFSNGIRPVLFRKAAAGEDVKSFIHRLILILMMLIMPAAGVIAVQADRVMLFIFGNKWIESGMMVQWMVIPAAFFVCTNWMDRLLDVYGKQKMMFIIEAIGTLISVGGLSYGLFIISSPEAGVALFSGGLLVQYLVIGYAALSSSGFSHRTIAIIFIKGSTVVLVSACTALLTSSNFVYSISASLIVGYLCSVTFFVTSINRKQKC